MKKNIFKLVIIMLIITFTIMYIISSTGYYEYNMQSKTILTNDKIKEFEEDVKNNKDIDIKKYYEKEKDYSNKFTNSINTLSNNIARYVFIAKTYSLLKGMFLHTSSISDLNVVKKTLCLFENKPSKVSIPHPGVLKFLTFPISSCSFGNESFLLMELMFSISS